MSTRFSSTLRIAALLACTLTMPAFAAEAAPPAPPPIADFFNNPAFSDANLSPNGKYLAVRFSNDNKRDRLIVIELATNAVKVVAQFADRDVNTFQWVNDERLVLDSTDKTIGPGDAIYGPGLFAVNRDGSNFRQLVQVSGNFVQEHGVARNVLPANHYLVGQKGAQVSDDVYVINPKRDGLHEAGDIKYVNLVRLNTVTGRTETVKRPGPARGWLLDHKGEPRLCMTLEQNIETIWYLDPASEEWRQIAFFDAYLGGKDAFTPLAFGPDGTLYVLSHAGKDKRALRTFDLATNKVSDKPVVALADYDFSGRLITSRDKLLGVRYLSDARATVWFDEKMKALQATIDAALPATANMINPPARPDSPWVLVQSYSDKQPERYMLYNLDTGKFNPVGSTHERIVPAQMAEQELVRITARDGLTVPTWLTLPTAVPAAMPAAARKNLPMVVLVHGGPYVRGREWRWSADSQFLASRGYAVLEPEFRGSTGFGTGHYRAGWKQWGLKMQDDIADATKWAIAQGIADPKRICIAGASYGGYATLMGLVNDPALYKCGINWVGVTDINLLYTGHWSFTSDMSSAYLKYGAPTLIGDPEKDAAQLRATSPVLQAARITQPLLMAYGGADRRVPLYHGKKFLEALKEHNQNVEWVVYQEEGHGWSLPKNRIDFWGRVEKFLARQIGTP
ncbi:alpha/beta hydrolase family protein [Massilia antarctica]|uniref:alpha/beta hydrolase family protein n=1 Tax=Massilia antarctica TaxID=2765360 RepID=UPI00226F43AF|nr:alpha/beta fold hydrolase [Massilia sp. H27-R4]MCY0915985.1 prolyl oligopeptidase family serine peptidase [Massilia sp. H27-R4]